MEKAPTSEALLRARLGPARVLLDADDIDIGALDSTLAMLDGAEIAHLLETTPAAQRMEVWMRIDDGLAAEVLNDLPEIIASDLMKKTPDGRLDRIGSSMDIEQMSDALELFPNNIQESLITRLSEGERKRFKVAIAYSEGSVGRVMHSDMLVSPENATVNDALEDIRKRSSFPEQTDQLFITDTHGALIGIVHMNDLLVATPDTPVTELMDKDPPRLRARETLEDASALFERDELVCAPVINREGKLVGRMAVKEVVDALREASEENAFFREGLRSDEDLFGRIWESARRRWLWLSLNLLTAFVASRVIGLFESTIQAMVVLATLMPIVASIAGNTGNQTVALVIRGLAMGGITPSNLVYLAGKELSIALINGLLWGGVMGGALVVIYHDIGLGVVMMSAITLNLGVAALAGVIVPLSMDAMGRDPALGSSVVLTFITDCMGCFIFLGLGAALLIP